MCDVDLDKMEVGPRHHNDVHGTLELFNIIDIQMHSSLVRLKIRYRIESKLLVLVYQAVRHIGPYAPTRSLRSAAHRSLTIPRYNLERYGRRAFSVTGPSLWNNLPFTIREAGTLTTFKSMLKTHLFRIAFKALC